MSNVPAYAAASAKSRLAPFSIERRTPGPKDVAIEILYCGVCHSDVHQTRDEWGGAIFPMVPGHEITGRVTAVGGQVMKFRPGDLAGVGVLVDSCRECGNCREGLEQFCDKEAVQTYNSRDKTGAVMYGGYSKSIVVDEAFVLKIRHPEAQLAGVAPLLCAGITTYSPLRRWGAGPGKKVGVVGLGGLGHMGLKLAHAMGAEVVQFTTSKNKVEDARRLGADAVVLSSDAAAMQAQHRSFDFILDTAAANHDINALLGLLKRDGTLALVGVPSTPYAVAAGPLIMGRRSLAGSAVGGLAETQEMLDYCAAHKIVSDIEMTPIQAVNEAYERVVRGDVKYRFVIDLASLA
ncbi:MAG TPA: NAD(P)-dependent alcohol dehydrogenase [Terriglobales bacterium]|nr:NAD(P)-dependent alcohol dehydrogenase [Terriglobales bacterium]